MNKFCRCKHLDNLHHHFKWHPDTVFLGWCKMMLCNCEHFEPMNNLEYLESLV